MPAKKLPCPTNISVSIDKVQAIDLKRVEDQRVYQERSLFCYVRLQEVHDYGRIEVDRPPYAYPAWKVDFEAAAARRGFSTHRTLPSSKRQVLENGRLLGRGNLEVCIEVFERVKGVKARQQIKEGAYDGLKLGMARVPLGGDRVSDEFDADVQLFSEQKGDFQQPLGSVSLRVQLNFGEDGDRSDYVEKAGASLRVPPSGMCRLRTLAGGYYRNCKNPGVVDASADQPAVARAATRSGGMSKELVTVKYPTLERYSRSYGTVIILRNLTKHTLLLQEEFPAAEKNLPGKTGWLQNFSAPVIIRQNQTVAFGTRDTAGERMHGSLTYAVNGQAGATVSIDFNGDASRSRLEVTTQDFGGVDCAVKEARSMHGAGEVSEVGITIRPEDGLVLPVPEMWLAVGDPHDDMSKYLLSKFGMNSVRNVSARDFPRGRVFWAGIVRYGKNRKNEVDDKWLWEQSYNSFSGTDIAKVKAYIVNEIQHDARYGEKYVIKVDRDPSNKFVQRELRRGGADIKNKMILHAGPADNASGAGWLAVVAVDKMYNWKEFSDRKGDGQPDALDFVQGLLAASKTTAGAGRQVGGEDSESMVSMMKFYDENPVAKDLNDDCDLWKWERQDRPDRYAAGEAHPAIPSFTADLQDVAKPYLAIQDALNFDPSGVKLPSTEPAMCNTCFSVLAILISMLSVAGFVLWRLDINIDVFELFKFCHSSGCIVTTVFMPILTVLGLWAIFCLCVKRPGKMAKLILLWTLMVDMVAMTAILTFLIKGDLATVALVTLAAGVLGVCSMYTYCVFFSTLPENVPLKVCALCLVLLALSGGSGLLTNMLCVKLAGTAHACYGGNIPWTVGISVAMLVTGGMMLGSRLLGGGGGGGGGKGGKGLGARTPLLPITESGGRQMMGKSPASKGSAFSFFKPKDNAWSKEGKAGKAANKKRGCIIASVVVLVLLAGLSALGYFFVLPTYFPDGLFPAQPEQSEGPSTNAAPSFPQNVNVFGWQPFAGGGILGSGDESAEPVLVLSSSATFDIDIATIADGSAERTTFEANFKAAVVAELGDGTVEADVTINSISSGSVVVDFSVAVMASQLAAKTIALTEGSLAVNGQTATVAAPTAAAAAAAAPKSDSESSSAAAPKSAGGVLGSVLGGGSEDTAAVPAPAVDVDAVLGLLAGAGVSIELPEAARRMLGCSSRMEVSVRSGTSLSGTDFLSAPDPFCTLDLHGHQHRTSVASNIVDGVATWNEHFNFTDVSPKDFLRIQCYDQDYIAGDQSMGGAEVDLATYFHTLRERPSYVMQEDVPLLLDGAGGHGKIQIQIKCPKMAGESSAQESGEKISIDSSATFPAESLSPANRSAFLSSFKSTMAMSLNAAGGSVSAESIICTVVPPGTVKFTIAVDPASAAASATAFVAVQAGGVSVGNVKSFSISSPVATPVADCGKCGCDQFASAAANGTCANLTSCAKIGTTVIEYETVAPSRTSDRVCDPLTVCADTQYITVAATSSSDRSCEIMAVCTAGDQFDRANAQEIFVQTGPHDFAPTYNSNRDCATTSVCDATQYEYGSPTPTSDRLCNPVTACTVDQYETGEPTLVTDRVCTAMTACVNGTQYQSVAPTALTDRACKAYSQCSSQQYETTPPTPVSDRACVGISHPSVPTAIDGGGLWQSVAPTPTSDAQLQSVTVCRSSEYQAVPATATTDRVCGEASAPAGNQYICVPATRISDATLCNVTKLACVFPDEFESIAATETSDRHCQPIQQCSAFLRFNYESQPPTPTSDRACTSLLICNGTEFESASFTEHSDRVCTPWSVCPTGLFETKAPTISTDRLCSAPTVLPDAPCKTLIGAKIKEVLKDGTLEPVLPIVPGGVLLGSVSDCCDQCAITHGCDAFQYEAGVSRCFLLGTGATQAATVLALAGAAKQAAVAAPPQFETKGGAKGVTSGWVVEALRARPGMLQMTPHNISAAAAIAAAAAAAAAAAGSGGVGYSCPSLQVTLHSGSHLGSTSALHNLLGAFTAPAISCTVGVGADSEQTAAVRSENPVWESSYVFIPQSTDSALDISCADSDVAGTDVIGTVSLLLAHVYRRIDESTTALNAVEVALTDDAGTVTGNVQLSFRCPSLTAANSSSVAALASATAKTTLQAGGVVGEVSMSAPAKARPTLFDECGEGMVMTVANAQSCLMRLEEKYSSTESEPVGSPGREYRLKQASNLIERIGTKAAALGR